MTKIITTIGPASEDIGSLMHFSEHKVEIARLNFSHNTPDWHIRIGKRARQAGLKLMVDLAGPKVLLGDLEYDIEIATGEIIIFEKQVPEKTYPLWENKEGKEFLVLPTYFDIAKFLQFGSDILIDDGKVELRVNKVQEGLVQTEVLFGGKIKSHKGINLPDTELDIDFLVERDRAFLTKVLPLIKPEFIAPSFVKNTQNLNQLKEFIKDILEKNEIQDYFPKICTKIEMCEAVDEQNLEKIIEGSEMIMIARGDLALETRPLHIQVPFLQQKIVHLCKQSKTPFIVATQILESMFTSPVPTRAEVSDLYRAVIIDQADYVMLSAESAAGKFPRKCVEVMEEMINISTPIII